MIGFAMPFIVLGVLLDVLAQLTVIIAIPLLVGIVLVGRGGGVLHHAGRWWRNAWRYFVNGFMNAATIAVFMALMVSCMSGFGTAGYRGGFY